MTQTTPTIEPERIKWSNTPIGAVTGWSHDERLFVNPFVAIDAGPEAGKWRVVDVLVGTARVYEGINSIERNTYERKHYTVISKGWSYDTAFLSLWVSNDLVNCHWWITRRDKAETALARGTCFGFKAAVEAAVTAAFAEMAECRKQLLEMPFLVVAPAKKEKVAA